MTREQPRLNEHEPAQTLATPSGAVRICYIDTSLRTDLGHYANSCRNIAGEFRRRQLSVDVYGNRSMPASMAKRLGATPFFRHAGFENILAHLPISVLFRADYLLGRTSFLQDLKSIWHRGPYDFLYLNSILPAQLAALATWLRTFPNGEAPAVVAEFGSPSGTGMADQVTQGGLNWRRHTPFYIEAAGLFRGDVQRPLLFTFDPIASADFASLLQMPVETMPTVHAGTEPPRLRCRRDGRITVSFLGHQRADKGYHLVPEIVRGLLAQSLPIRILVHNGDPENDPISQELEAMAKDLPELVFEHAPADAKYWQDLLERSDLIALPYEPPRYRASYSAVAVEAVSAGIPLVVPAGTTMEALMQSYQAGATSFSDWDACEIVKAIEMAVNDFEKLAQMSAAGASRRNNENGAQNFVDRLLQLRPIESKTRIQYRIKIGERVFNLVLDAFFSITMNAMRAARAILLFYRRSTRKFRTAASRAD